MKRELIEFIIENNEIAEPGFKEKVQNKIDITEAIIMMKRCREIMQIQKKKIINILGMQDHLLKKFKDNVNLFKTLNQSKSAFYSKINFHNFLKKYSVLKQDQLF